MDLETIAGALTEIHSVAGKQLTGTGDTAHVVLSDVDLLSEILLRLPLVSVLRFKSVSKQWLSLIKSPYFMTLWRRNRNPNLDPPSGLFLERHDYRNVAYDLVRLDYANKSRLNTDFPFSSVEEGDVQILHSCNGLLLCDIVRSFKLFVFNPSTNQFRKLPDEHYSDFAKFNVVKLAFDPTKSPHYKVIVGTVNDDDDESFQFETYSSETNDWSVYHERFPTINHSYFYYGIYWNGAIHWIDSQNMGLHNKLDVNNLVLTTISKPTFTLDENLNIDLDRKLFESHGCLLLACLVNAYSTRSLQLIIYEKRNECSEWSVKSVINIDDIRTLLPDSWKVCPQLDFVRCIVLGEREEDSFLVFEIYGKIIQYNFVLKAVCKIYNASPPLPSFYLRCLPFIPCLAGV